MCDIQNCCRICLDQASDHVAILGDPTISLHLKACLSISVSGNDHLPKTVCMSCVSLLSQFYNFQITARCSQDWLESSLQEKTKKSSENKMPLQPLPDSEYNSDSLLEFLNNTANIEEYLNNLGKEDIPCIVNILDRNEHNIANANSKLPSPKKKDAKKNKMEVDMLANDAKVDKNTFVCFGCKMDFDNVPKLLQHMSVCDFVLRTCVHCKVLFNSKQQMQLHTMTHMAPSLTCSCGEQFQTKERLLQHHKMCYNDYAGTVGCVYRCKECGDTFKERFQLYKHAKEHIIRSEERICDICGHIFIGSDALTAHRKEEHRVQESETPENVMFRCKICSYTSPDRKEIYAHVKNHTTSNRHLCESCGRSFASRAALKRHMSQHETDVSCKICSKEFVNMKILESHMLEHIQMAICEKCGQNVVHYKLHLHVCEE